MVGNISTLVNDVVHTPFPELLHDMITAESKGKDGATSPVRWGYDGAAFVIENTQPALNNILRRYFNHGRYTSLQRQLNMYGFKRSFSGKYEGAVHHPSGFFHRDKKHWLCKLKRKPPPGRAKAKEQKLGTRKRKVNRRNSNASESSSLIREAALVNNDGTQETYYYGSDISTANENSTLGDERPDYQDMEMEPAKNSKVGDSAEDVPRNVAMFQKRAEGENGDSTREVGPKVLRLDFKGGAPKEQNKSSNKILLPFSLKKVMLNTWENISQRKLIPVVPAPISVRRALKLYVDAKVDFVASTKSSKLFDDHVSPVRLEKRKAGWKDLAEGIAVFFDKALPTRLLYRQELPQFRALQANKKRMSDIYGCEHLLRLLLRLPDILAECVSDETRIQILQDIVEFVRFLHQHKETLCSSSFRELTAEELEEIGKESD